MAVAFEELLAGVSMFPEDFWNIEDDRCDCVFQRIGMWTNPYLAETLEVRFCCIWQELHKLFPDKVRATPAFLNYNTHEWETEPQQWNGEVDMPRSLWYRQLARQNGISVGEARQRFAHLEPPKGAPLPEAEPEGPAFSQMLFAQVINLKRRVEELESK